MSVKQLVLGMVLTGAVAPAQPPVPAPPLRSPVPAISPADAEKLIGGLSIITLHLKEAGIEQVRVEWEKQLKQPVRIGEIDEDQRKKPVTLDFDKKPFWEAVRLMAETQNLRLYPQGRHEWALIGGGAGELRGKVLTPWGVARIALQRVARSYDIDFTGDEAAKTGLGERSHAMDTQFAVALDPRLDLLNNLAVSSDIVAMAGSAQSTIAHDAIGFYNQDAQSWHLEVPLGELDGPNRRLVSLRGALKFYVVTNWVRWDVPLQTKGARTVVRTPEGEETYTLREFVKTDEGYRAQIGIAAPLVIAPGPEQATQLARQLREARRDLGQWARLTDAEGRAYVAQTGEVGDDKLEILFVPGAPPDDAAAPNKLGPPQKLTLNIPADVREMEIPFDFKDLPLP